MALGTDYIITYIPDTIRALRGARDLGNVNKFIAREIGQEYANATRIVGKNLDELSTKDIKLKGGKKAIKSVERLGVVVETADGKFKQINGTFTGLNGKITNVKGGIKDVTNQFKKTNVETEKGKKNFVGLTENIKRLGSRALLTIPLWLAFRTAMTAVFSSISNGIKSIIEQDRVFAKLRKNIQGTNTEIRAELAKAKETITKFSIESGKSIEEITTAVQRFKTSGFDIDTALSAGLDATRLAVVLFGTAEETANAFARSLRALATDTNNTEQTQREIAEAMALTSELWEENSFELDEFSNGLERFGGTAKALGLTMQETITLLGLLSTRGLNANRAGRLLSTSTIKLQTNLDEVASVLGIKVNPEVDRTFDVFMKVVQAIADLRGEKGLDGLVKISPKVAEAVSKIFGGTKGGEPIFDIVADMEAVSKEFDKFLNKKPDVDGFRESFKDMDEDLFRQVEIYHNLNKEIGKTFITGVLGADDFAEALQKITEIQKSIYSNAESFGNIVTKIYRTQAQVFTFGAVKIKSPTPEIEKIRKEIEESFKNIFPTLTLPLESMKITGGFDSETLKKAIDDIITVQTQQLDVGVSEEDLNKGLVNAREQLLSINKKILDTTKKEEDALKKTNQVLLEKKDFLKLENNIRQELLASGLDNVSVEEKILELREESNRFVNKDIVLQKELIQHLGKIQEIELKRTKERGLIDNQLLLLQLQGATNSELLKAERAYENMYGLKQSQLQQLEFELALQKELTKEKSVQNSVSSDTVKLFKIAKKFGTGTAFGVSEVLKGTRDVPERAFTESDKKIKSALDEFFASVVEAREVMKFFTEGQGRFIPTAETGITGAVTPTEIFFDKELNKYLQRPKTLSELTPTLPGGTVPQIKLPGITTNIDSIKVEVKQAISETNLSDAIKNALISALEGDTRIQQAIDERIENY